MYLPSAPPKVTDPARQAAVFPAGLSACSIGSLSEIVLKSIVMRQLFLRLPSPQDALSITTGWRGGLIQPIGWDGTGLCLFAGRLEQRFCAAESQERPGHFIGTSSRPL